MNAAELSDQAALTRSEKRRPGPDQGADGSGDPSDTGNRADLGEIEVDWADPPTLADLKSDLEESRTAHNEQVAKIDGWLENLNVEGKAKIKAGRGRSSVVPKLIRKQAEWRYSALSEPFLSTESLFNSEPVTWEDQRAAEQNKLVLNQQINKDIEKNRFIEEYVRTTVDEGTAFLKVGWSYEDEEYEEEVPVVELYEDPSFMQTLQEVMQLQQTDPNGYETQVPDELKQAVEASMQDQIAYRPEIVGTEIEIKTRILANHPTVEVCDYRNIYIDPTCHGDMSKASFAIHTFESSLAELEKDGRYSNLDRINVETNSVTGEPEHASSQGIGDFQFRDKPRKKFVVNEYWGFRDVEGEGKMTAIVAAWVGNTMIRLGDNPFPDKELPFVNVQYLPVRRSVYGEPDGALLVENQQILGAVTRGMIDILGRSANGQTGIRRDMLDAANRRKFEAGDDYQFNIQADPRQSVYMHTFPEIPNSAQFMLQQQNMEAESLTGVKAFSGGLSGQELGDTATGIRGVLDAASKRELGILRRLAQGVVKVGRKFTSMNAVFLSDVEVVRITNKQFVEVRKEELAGKFDLQLSISTAEEDDAKAQELAFMLQTMGNNVDFSIVKMILAKLFMLRKLPDLAHAIEQYEPQPDPLDVEIKQLEAEKLRAEIEEIRSQAQENLAEAGLDAARAGTEQARAGKLNAEADKTALEFVEQESGVTQERDLQKVGEQARGNMQLETLKNQNKSAADARKEAAIIQKDAAKQQGDLLRAYLKQADKRKAA